MQATDIPQKALLEADELKGITMKIEQLKSYLEANDFENALQCINQMNDVNNQSFYNIIGKLARGLHSAISDLNLSSVTNTSENNPTRVDLDYVMKVTDEAAIKTLDMTEKSRTYIGELSDMYAHQQELLDAYKASDSQDAAELVRELDALCSNGKQVAGELNSNITEIIIAQNFQDLTSQSISKAINIINEVENSLISLVHYTNLLKKLSRFTDENIETLEPQDSEEIRSDIDQMEKMNEGEHLGQDDVDDLLSSLGF